MRYSVRTKAAPEMVVGGRGAEAVAVLSFLADMELRELLTTWNSSHLSQTSSIWR
jgi:hypothetical protein